MLFLPISFQERSMSDADNAGSNDQTDDASHCTSKPIDIDVPLVRNQNQVAC